MKNELMDLHIHTTNSDGDDTVETILGVAQQKNLSVISFTDHNNVDAYYDLNGHRSIFKGKILTGAELSTTFSGELIGILAYGFKVDVIKDFIDNNYLSFEQKTLKERLLILKQYRKKGIILSKEFCNIMETHPAELYDPAHESCRVPFFEEMKKHEENNRFLPVNITFNDITSREFFRNYYTNPFSDLYVDTSSLFPTIDSIIKAVHKAEGKCFLAHCMLYSNDFKNSLESFLETYDFDGLECFHTFFTTSQSEYLIKLCDKYNIYKSGGSDYHGHSRSECILGKSTEGQNINLSLSYNWLKGIKNYV